MNTENIGFCGMEYSRNIPEPISIEVWVDEKENIYMVNYTFFPYRFNKKELVNNLIGEYAHGDFPYISYWKFYYYDHKDFNDGVTIPLRTKIEHYKIITNPCVEEKIKQHQILMQVKNIDINNSSFIAWTLLSSCDDPTYIDEIQEVIIYPENIVVNEVIPEETFIAPKPDIPVYWTEKEQENFFLKHLEKKENVNSQQRLGSLFVAFIFVLFCIVFTFLGIVVTKYFFGWGI
ncbi:MAG: hypothetical protein ACP5KS_11860 [Candidatus Hydrogenedens sp.]